MRVQGPRSKVQGPRSRGCKVQGANEILLACVSYTRSKVQGLKSKVRILFRSLRAVASAGSLTDQEAKRLRG